MEIALTLIAPSSKPLVNQTTLSTIKKALEASGAEIGNEQILNGSVSRRIELSATDISALHGPMSRSIDGLPIDYALLPALRNRARLLIADMDSTIIQCECLDELADLAGCGDAVSAITERAMRGELDFEGALRERVKMLTGLPEKTLQETYQKRINLMSGATALVSTMKENGAITALVSGGFTYFTSRVATETGFELNFGNTLEIEDGVLTGNVVDPILGRAAKLETLERICSENRLNVVDAIAVGDGANDLAMIQRAGIGVSYHGKPVVEQGADIAIRHTDLTSLLYIQGYTQDEIKNPTA